MAILKQTGGGPFYKTGPLYMHAAGHAGPGDGDGEKKKNEAQTKANQNAASSERVYGEATTTSEKTVQDGVRGTLFTTTKPYTQSGTGSAEGTMSYAEFEAKGGDVAAAKEYRAKQALSGQDVSTSFRADVKAISLKPKGLVPLSVPLSAPKIEIPETPKPTYSGSMEFGGRGKTSTLKIDAPEGSKFKKSGGGGNSCGCDY